MQKIFPADTVGMDGTVYPTIGENIRNSSKVSADSISNAITNNTDRAKITHKLDVEADVLKQALISLLTGNTAYFGGYDSGPLTEEQLSQIKTYLGVS